MKAQDALYIVIAAALLYVVTKMFKHDPADDAESSEKEDASRFVDLWELFDVSPALRAAREGKVTPSQMAAVAPRAAAISLDVERLRGAPSNWYAWDDDERAVLGAVMRSTYPEQILFSEVFKARTGITPGAFIRSFMSPSSDYEYLSPIVRHIEALRP